MSCVYTLSADGRARSDLFRQTGKQLNAIAADAVSNGIQLEFQMPANEMELFRWAKDTLLTVSSKAIKNLYIFHCTWIVDQLCG